ncbi:DUF1998 domain-containing protein [Mesorhizobium sp. RP14(2022)]|uniref:DUF1998 domain-containing protein n=1 Tax=Mesorhizobium liriopis TaxID=2953882 RepID=A0ABT1C157_9HYPH|nr:DUF1998 domain-containing protein [Mesorhizobium liriopis]MCO6048373.1 DUF1998 domain-containing protein [Mesorhizobium liriopis]
MSRITQSMSQLLTSFGPGAMMDLPTRSVLVAGLDHWDARQTAFKSIEEPRLAALLHKVLSENNRWDPSKPVKFRTPPIARDVRNGAEPDGVQVRVFPTWFTCEGLSASGAPDPRRRRLVRWEDLEANGRKKFQRPEDRKKVDVTPIRFVGACEKGHLQDIDWKWLVHRGDKCAEPMWIEEEGSSADPANIRIGCDCGRPSVSLADAFKPGFLGMCHGRRPWLDSHEPGCGERLHFLSRSATNTYFAQTVTVISLPTQEDALSTAIRRHWTSLQGATDPHFVSVLRNVPEIGAALSGYDDAEVHARIVQLREAATLDAAQDPKIAEFDLLGSGRAVIGSDGPREPLFAETLADLKNVKPKTIDDEDFIDSIVAVHRLKAVMCLYGFTRLEPSPTIAEAMLEDVRLAVDGAPLAEFTDWLPAMEQLGEGIFIKLRSAALRTWAARTKVRLRSDLLERGLLRHDQKQGTRQANPGLPYLLLHSLSHALMQEIALECGYPLSSLKERVYALASSRSDVPDRFGLLIFTASAGAQGTLGGLAEVAERTPELIKSALERLRLCSNDPVCADHDPSLAGGERHLHGAACHSCLLVPETSCERRNVFLDRALLVETVANVDAEMFP